MKIKKIFFSTYRSMQVSIVQTRRGAIVETIEVGSLFLLSGKLRCAWSGQRRRLSVNYCGNNRVCFWVVP